MTRREKELRDEIEHEIDRDVREVGGHGVCDVAYEALVADARGALRELLAFCGEEYTGRLDRYLSHHRVTDQNRKWRAMLSPLDIEEIDCILSARPVCPP